MTPTESDSPAWTRGASRRHALWRGAIEAPSLPVIVVLWTFIGFGALVRDLGLALGHAVFVALTVFALPGQVVLVDQAARGATLVAATFAVALTAARLLPMTVALMPLLRDGVTPRWLAYLLSHFVAITVWLESMRRLPRLPMHLRVPYLAGLGICVMLASGLATVLGYVTAVQLPTSVAAGLIFLSPIYFYISLMAASETGADAVAIVAGTVLGPAIFLLLPGFDLLLAGLIGGTLAYAIDRGAGHRRP